MERRRRRRVVRGGSERLPRPEEAKDFAQG